MGGAPHPAAGGTEVYTDMEQWTEIRRRVLVDGRSKRQACKQFAINGKTLRKILTHAEPPGYLQVFPRECTETFQEGHARAFAGR